MNPIETKRKPSALVRYSKRALLVVTLGYVAILAVMLANEQQLVYPGSTYPKGNWEPSNFNFEEIEFQSADGTSLIGWYLRKPHDLSADAPDRTVMVCHGNGENVSESSRHNGDNFRRALGADVFEFDYRGFGKCQGSPNEERVLADAEAALDWICEKTGKQPKDIILVGHSLGGGPAVHLAAKLDCKALILQRTFSSIKETAQYNYPWLPVKYLMQNEYPSFEKIKTVTRPLYQSHGSEDKLIPIKLARKLFANSPATQKTFNEVKGMGHFDPLPPEYWAEIVRFVNLIQKTDPGA